MLSRHMEYKTLHETQEVMRHDVGVPAIGSAEVEKAYTWIRGKLSAVNKGLRLAATGPGPAALGPGLAVALGPGLAPALGPGLDPPFEVVRLARPMKTSRKSVAF